MALADGITHIVATPHANDRYHYDREYLVKALVHLRELVGDSPKLTLGCDFHLSYDNLQAALAHPMRYTIQGSNYLLVELSNYSVPAGINDCFRNLGDKGVIPLITHPERNPILQCMPERVLEWVQLGCGIQVTASALVGHWGEKVQTTAKWLLQHKAVHVLASDAHDINYRIPNLSEGREVAAEICGVETARALVEDNPRAVVSGEPLPYFPKPVGKYPGRSRG